MVINQTMQTGFNSRSIQTNGAAPPVWAQPPMLPTSSAMLPGMMQPPKSAQSSAMQVHLAAATAAAAAVPSSKKPSGKAAAKEKKKNELSAEEKARASRDRNREHARSTRLRKKAYVQKLKELVEGLHAERTEEVRKRRVAVQHLAEKQSVRRAVVRSFLRFHASYEGDPRKWMTLLEDNFWFKQPVTPYRSFRRAEIEQESRVSRGVDAMIADAASVSVTVEGIGSRSARWMQIKREDLLQRGTRSSEPEGLPHSIVPQNTRYQHAMSSLSSSSSSGGSAGEESRRQLKRPHSATTQAPGVTNPADAAKRTNKQKASNEFHDYNAPSLPDPKLDSDGSSPGEDYQGDSSNSSGGEGGGTKQVSTDSSSGEDDRLSDSAVKSNTAKRAKVSIASPAAASDGTPGARQATLPPNIAKSGGISHNVRPLAAQNGSVRLGLAPPTPLPPFQGLGKRPAVATTVGAVSVAPLAPNAFRQEGSIPGASVSGTVQSLQPTAVSLDTLPEAASSTNGMVGPTLISADVDGSSNDSSQSGQIRAYYHVNEDDMILTEDVLMCPFIFRSQDAVLCGALAECIMPGMLRAHFSARNKLLSVEMVYDAMGFMQQLERASGSEGTAQIVPGSLEMALSPNTHEARVITMASAPYLIVSVNEAWTRTTKYTQMEVEGRDLTILNGTKTDLEAAVRPGKPPHRLADVAQGRCACSTNIHYDKDGRDFVDYVCSYPLTNTEDEITHILHVCKELPLPSRPHEFADSNGDRNRSSQ